MLDGWRHDLHNVRLLQDAHADCVEAVFREDFSLPGNLKRVEIKSFGETRTFYRSTEPLQNRIFFTGNETSKRIDEVLRYFVDRNADCIMDVNPANFQVLPHLLTRGCSVEEFRSVWVCTGDLGRDESDFRLDCRRVDVATFRRLSPLVEDGEAGDPVDDLQPDPGFTYYPGFDNERPVASAAMFFNGESVYLQWTGTHPDYRRRGYHGEMIRLRLGDAFEMGAKRAFSVTEFDSQSSYDLPRLGFTLTYNWLLIVREPRPLE